MNSSEHSKFDFVIVGSGFGGAVSALRLSEKGYKVAVIEKGRRLSKEDFPVSNRQVSKFFWAPLIKCFGIQEISLLKGVMVLHGAGVGGGSLVYANTLMQPLDSVYDDPDWPTACHWKKELEPHFLKAKNMLGVTTNRIEAYSDSLMKSLGSKLGCEETYHLTEVGVFFGEANDKGAAYEDPYFNGQGPSRYACTGCGGCMVGCRVGAKNTLDQNYLYLAEKLGAVIIPDTKLTKISGEDGNYYLKTKNTQKYFVNGETLLADKIILSAGVMGTLEILFKNKEVYKTLTNISEQLGSKIRTNGESLCGVTTLTDKHDFSKGIAIGSAIHPDAKTKIEPVRYPSGSDVMRFLAVPLTGSGGVILRPIKLFLNIIFNFTKIVKLFLIKDWAKSSVILLVMQSIDQKMKIKLGRSYLTLWQKNLIGDESNQMIPSFLPIAQKATLELSNIVEGVPQNVSSEVLLGIPATAHILGGCCMGNSAADGVIDYRHELFGHPGIFVCDGSVVPVNLGVNPSLTITAMAERFAELFPYKK